MRLSTLLLLAVFTALSVYGVNASRQQPPLADAGTPSFDPSAEWGTPTPASTAENAQPIVAVDTGEPALLRYDLTIERDGEVVHAPAVLVLEGQEASVEVGDPCGDGDHYALQILPNGQIFVTAMLRDGTELIARPQLLVEVGVPAEVSIEGEERRSSFAVLATCHAF